MNKRCGLPVIYLGNNVCQFVQEVKYLGVIIHSTMKTTIDVARQTRKFYLQANLLLRNSRHCSGDVKCALFQTYCTNMYCCQLWFNSTKSSIKKLSTSYNSVLRRLLCIIHAKNMMWREYELGDPPPRINSRARKASEAHLHDILDAIYKVGTTCYAFIVESDGIARLPRFNAECLNVVSIDTRIAELKEECFALKMQSSSYRHDYV